MGPTQLLDLLQQQTSDAVPARRRVDVHPLDLTGPAVQSSEGDAAHGTAAQARDDAGGVLGQTGPSVMHAVPRHHLGLLRGDELPQRHVVSSRQLVHRFHRGEYVMRNVERPAEVANDAFTAQSVRVLAVGDQQGGRPRRGRRPGSPRVQVRCSR